MLIGGSFKDDATDTWLETVIQCSTPKMAILIGLRTALIGGLLANLHVLDGLLYVTVILCYTLTSLHLQVFWCSKSIPVLLVLPSSPVSFCKILIPVAKNSDFWLDKKKQRRIGCFCY